ncbi:DUF3973 domain-containing protein [Paenibacillus alginolyticus]|uniref:DUF3973 domain-containing protein n=1 Tax=Paenibacillus alginolyticus TaxID=59839 RepID=UPI000492ABB7
MYYCLNCNKTHEKHSETGTIFSSGFTTMEDKVMNVGYCKASISAKTNSDALEEKLAYLKRHAC